MEELNVTVSSITKFKHICYIYGSKKLNLKASTQFKMYFCTVHADFSNHRMKVKFPECWISNE